MVMDEGISTGFSAAVAEPRDCQNDASRNGEQFRSAFHLDNVALEGEKHMPVPYTIPGVLHFIQHEWVKFELERSQWDIERAELKARVAFLQGERKGQENLKNDLVRRVKMLEYALRQERLKNYRLVHGANCDTEELLLAESKLVESEMPTEVDVSLPTDQTRSGSCWRQGRLLLKQYLEEIGYTDTILDVKNYRIRSMLGVNNSAVGSAEANVGDSNEYVKFVPSASTSNIPCDANNEMAEPSAEGMSEAEKEALAEFRFLRGSDQVDLDNTTSTDWTNVDYKALNKKKVEFKKEAMQKKTITKKVPSWKEMLDKFSEADEEERDKMTSDNKDSATLRFVNKDEKYTEELEATLSSFSDMMNITVPVDRFQTVVPDVSEASRKTWTVRFTLRSHFDCVRAIAFHPVEAIVLTASEDATIKLWNLQKNLSGQGSHLQAAKQSVDLEPVYTFRGHSSPVLSMCMSTTGDYCYTGGLDGTVRCWMMPPSTTEAYDPLDKQITCDTLTGHTDSVWSVAYHSSDNRLISASADGTVKVWDPCSAGKRQLLSTYVADTADLLPTSVDFMSTDLHQAVAAYSSGAAYVYDLECEKSILRFPPNANDPSYNMSLIHRILSHPTLPITITAHDDRTIRFFDNNSGLLIDSVVAHLDSVTCLSIDPNGLYLLSGSHDGSLRLWNVDSKACLQETTAHRKKFDESLFAVAFHPSHPMIASAGADGLTKIFM